MSELSRRDLLKMAALGLGAVVVEACKSPTAIGPSAATSAAASYAPGSAEGPTPEPTELPADSIPPEATESLEPPPSPELPTDSPLPTSVETASSTPSSGAATPRTTARPTPRPTPRPTQSGPPELVVARKGSPEALVRGAIGALGGMRRFVKPGASVVVKPNICVAYRSYEYAATTNPWVVATVVKMAFEAGAASVKVMDYPFGGTAADAYVKSGIKEQVEAAGGEMVVMSSRNYVSVKVPSGHWLKQTEVYADILNASVLINVPIAKRHGSATMTGAMKNLLGCVRDRPTLHGSLNQAIADINTLIRPELTVLDAVRILTAHGPTGGNLADVKKLDTVIATTDVVAADAYAATFFGLRASNLGYVKLGGSMGLGHSDLSKVRIKEITV